MFDADPVAAKYGWRPEWRERAACLGMDTEMFFPEKDGDDSPMVTERNARAVCATCPVVKECRGAFDRIESAQGWYLYGIVGGETPVERRERRAVEAAEALDRQPSLSIEDVVRFAVVLDAPRARKPASKREPRVVSDSQLGLVV